MILLTNNFTAHPYLFVNNFNILVNISPFPFNIRKMFLHLSRKVITKVKNMEQTTQKHII